MKDSDDRDPVFQAVLESAARLQRLVPDAVVVGGTAAAVYAHHRASFDHDHVVGDLASRFDVILDALSREPDFVLNRVRPGKIILGELGDIEVGVRQLIRARPLEVVNLRLPSGSMVRVPTWQETLRIKAYLIVKRNQVRDFLDVAALADQYGVGRSADVLANIDDYYADSSAPPSAVASQLVRQLAAPRPRDAAVITQLESYKGLSPRWHDWDTVLSVTKQLAVEMVLRTAGRVGGLGVAIPQPGRDPERPSL